MSEQDPDELSRLKGAIKSLRNVGWVLVILWLGSSVMWQNVEWSAAVKASIDSTIALTLAIVVFARSRKIDEFNYAAPANDKISLGCVHQALLAIMMIVGVLSVFALLFCLGSLVH